ncbi:MAG TPA: lipocalin-like domain-containing protein [Vicinamibacterales bacterium]|nr:lipocalin-like domain-containing protein [Vicinamibacterales bacterium]
MIARPPGVVAILACVLLAATNGMPSGSADKWQQASPGRRISLPGDHRSHPEYRIEWWYYTGTLHAREDGRRFGYQLTFFRIGVNVEPPTPSRWAVRDLHMAHFAITDVEAARHVATERLNRSGPGWAGASETTYRVWNETWFAQLEGTEHRLSASDPGSGLAIELRLREGRSPVRHGIDGFSQKGSSPGNASYYYSITRMPTEGTLTVGGRTHEVTGTSWMDHEFGTTFLERNQAGWDWFSVQLADGRDLMVFQLRNRDGSSDARSSGTLVSREGARPLDANDIRLEPLRRWKSPSSGASYPVEWRVALPREDLRLHVRAVIDAQELHGLPSGVTYWEGAVDIEGESRGAPASGVGYLEMTGYGGRPMGEVMSSNGGLDGR